jgi:hypothetical protein
VHVCVCVCVYACVCMHTHTSSLSETHVLTHSFTHLSVCFSLSLSLSVRAMGPVRFLMLLSEIFDVVSGAGVSSEEEAPRRSVKALFSSFHTRQISCQRSSCLPSYCSKFAISRVKARLQNAQSLSNILWAYATLGRAPVDGLMREEDEEEEEEEEEGLFRADAVNEEDPEREEEEEEEEGLWGLEGRMQAVAGGFSAQAVANTLWAYASHTHTRSHTHTHTHTLDPQLGLGPGGSLSSTLYSAEGLGSWFNF